jgi:hypothetical protein
LKEAQKALAIHMVILSKGCKFITCWGDGSAMFERLYYKNDESAKFVKWEFEIEEG